MKNLSLTSGVTSGVDGLEQEKQLKSLVDFEDTSGSTSSEVLIDTYSRSLLSQEYVIGFGNSITEPSQNFARQACTESGGKMKWVKNAGVSGNTTQQMLDRLDDDIKKGFGNTCVVMEATNDSNTGAITNEQHTANMSGINQELKERGYKPIVVLAPPNDDPTRSLSIEEMNVKDWVMCRRNGVACFNPWLSFSGTDGGYIDGVSDDGSHPTTETHTAAGKVLYDQLSGGKFGFPYARNNNYGIFENPLMMSDTDSDGEPDGWSVSGTGTLENTTLCHGNTLKISYTGSSNPNSKSPFFSVEAGKTYVISFHYGFTSISGNGRKSLQLVNQEGDLKYNFLTGGVDDVEDQEMYIEYTATEDDTSLQLWVRCITPVGGGSYTTESRVGQFTIFCIDDNESDIHTYSMDSVMKNIK